MLVVQTSLANDYPTQFQLLGVHKGLYRKLGISVTFSDTTSTAAKQQTQRQAEFLESSLKKNAVKREHFLTFMGKILDNNHAEVAPPLQEYEERWYLPLFGVYHTQQSFLS
jgi:hypothetical protein